MAWKHGEDPIHIKPSRVGTFTDAAQRHHEGVQAFATQVLAHPGDFSEHTEKQAEFAHNARKFKH